MFSLSASDPFKKTLKYLTEISDSRYREELKRAGQAGVEALSKATPLDSGETRSSWRYEIIQERGNFGVRWLNDHDNDGVNIAVILQYGHATGTGGWVQGRDYINPAIRPVFDQLADDIRKAVKRG